MDALKNAASGMFNSSGGAGKPNLAVGGTAAQTGVGAPSAALPATHKPTMFDQGIDAAQNAGILPKTGTQQGMKETDRQDEAIWWIWARKRTDRTRRARRSRGIWSNIDISLPAKINNLSRPYGVVTQAPPPHPKRNGGGCGLGKLVFHPVVCRNLSRPGRQAVDTQLSSPTCTFVGPCPSGKTSVLRRLSHFCESSLTFEVLTDSPGAQRTVLQRFFDDHLLDRAGRAGDDITLSSKISSMYTFLVTSNPALAASGHIRQRGLALLSNVAFVPQDHGLRDRTFCGEPFFFSRDWLSTCRLGDDASAFLHMLTGLVPNPGATSSEDPNAFMKDVGATSVTGGPLRNLSGGESDAVFCLAALLGVYPPDSAELRQTRRVLLLDDSGQNLGAHQQSLLRSKIEATCMAVDFLQVIIVTHHVEMLDPPRLPKGVLRFSTDTNSYYDRNQALRLDHLELYFARVVVIVDGRSDVETLYLVDLHFQKLNATRNNLAPNSSQRQTLHANLPTSSCVQKNAKAIKCLTRYGGGSSRSISEELAGLGGHIFHALDGCTWQQFRDERQPRTLGDRPVLTSLYPPLVHQLTLICFLICNAFGTSLLVPLDAPWYQGTNLCAMPNSGWRRQVRRTQLLKSGGKMIVDVVRDQAESPALLCLQVSEQRALEKAEFVLEKAKSALEEHKSGATFVERNSRARTDWSEHAAAQFNSAPFDPKFEDARVTVATVMSFFQDEFDTTVVRATSADAFLRNLCGQNDAEKRFAFDEPASVLQWFGRSAGNSQIGNERRLLVCVEMARNRQIVACPYDHSDDATCEEPPHIISVLARALSFRSKDNSILEELRMADKYGRSRASQRCEDIRDMLHVLASFAANGCGNPVAFVWPPQTADIEGIYFNKNVLGMSPPPVPPPSPPALAVDSVAKSDAASPPHAPTLVPPLSPPCADGRFCCQI
ncbi:hypothetical protein DFJ77DRAFT_440919 [Powellomyces hirtus]|nr:hypothetical protein DFJ77DRAFT_440919 [Powellomyces hirtus]